MTIDPKSCDPYKHWLIRVNGGAPESGRRQDVDALPWWTLSGWAADDVVEVVCELVPAVERPEWEVLRDALDILDGHDWPRDLEAPDVFDFVHEVADGLEAEHKRAQAEKAAEAAREELIEQAARVLFESDDVDLDWNDPGLDKMRGEYRGNARALADAGLLSAPTTDGGEA